ncbi:MAG: putative fusion protein of y4aC and y4aD [Rhodospirillales bacterium]|nr:putative fusion protein of y4aC and y4aD [Rhodospirillales bacterium]
MDPSKTRHDENFPVGSFLLARPLRPHVHAWYRFARAADDAADAPGLAPADKLARIDALELGLVDGSHPDSAPLKASGKGLDHARELLVAFRADARGESCASWDDLLRYCRFSAAPVGRYLLDIHGEDRATWPAGDALCAALQILNHLQDCGDDNRNLDRRYVPENWIPAGFFDPANVALRRPVLDRCLDGVEDLLSDAAALPGQIKSTRLRFEVRSILRLARTLTHKLRLADPIATRVRLRKRDFLRSFALSWSPVCISDEEIVIGRVARARSSFVSGMKALPSERKRGMFALYAFCRDVDDIADGAGKAEGKLALLAAWGRDLDALYAGTAKTPLTRELRWAVERFKLPRSEFELVLDGMRTDSGSIVRMPDGVALANYCRCVAGAVGVLSVHVFGAPDPVTVEFAVRLGHALQLTNILRDVDGDAREDRLYVPQDLLDQFGIDGSHALEATRHPGFARACAALAEEAKAAFATVDVPRATIAKLKPALLMMGAYRRLLSKLLARGWTDRKPVPKTSLPEKAQIALKVALAR